jgi:hypothetical protein
VLVVLATQPHSFTLIYDEPVSAEIDSWLGLSLAFGGSRTNSDYFIPISQLFQPIDRSTADRPNLEADSALRPT